MSLMPTCTEAQDTAGLTFGALEPAASPLLAELSTPDGVLLYLPLSSPRSPTLHLCTLCSWLLLLLCHPAGPAARPAVREPARSRQQMADCSEDGIQQQPEEDALMSCLHGMLLVTAALYMSDCTQGPVCCSPAPAVHKLLPHHQAAAAPVTTAGIAHGAP
jgi:hypothetical protein